MGSGARAGSPGSRAMKASAAGRRSTGPLSVAAVCGRTGQQVGAGAQRGRSVGDDDLLQQGGRALRPQEAQRPEHRRVLVRPVHPLRRHRGQEGVDGRDVAQPRHQPQHGGRSVGCPGRDGRRVCPGEPLGTAAATGAPCAWPARAPAPTAPRRRRRCSPPSAWSARPDRARSSAPRPGSGRRAPGAVATAPTPPAGTCARTRRPRCPSPPENDSSSGSSSSRASGGHSSSSSTGSGPSSVAPPSGRCQADSVAMRSDTSMISYSSSSSSSSDHVSSGRGNSRCARRRPIPRSTAGPGAACSPRPAPPPPAPPRRPHQPL